MGSCHATVVLVEQSCWADLARDGVDGDDVGVGTKGADLADDFVTENEFLWLSRIDTPSIETCFFYCDVELEGCTWQL